MKIFETLSGFRQLTDEAVYEKLWKPNGSKYNKQSDCVIFFFAIAKAIPKKYALHLI